MNASFKEILEAINTHNGQVIDSHDRERGMRKILAIAQLGNTVVALHDASHYSMNELSLGEDGRVTMTRWSVAVMYPEYNTGTLEEAVANYNKAQSENNPFSSGELTELTRVAA